MMQRWAMRWIGTAALAVVCVACTSAPRAATPSPALTGRSLATDSRPLIRLEQRAAQADHPQLAWYQYRNDIQPAVDAGFAGPILEFTAIRARDRQSSHDGRIRDNFQHQTTRTRIQGTVR